MKLIETLKWMWDPRTDEEKAYAEWDRATPLQKRTVTLLIYIDGIDTPFEHECAFRDFEFMGEIYRDATNEKYFNDEVKGYLGKIPKNGITIGDVWYPPKSINRVEIGKNRLELL
jgi:hypothetical protein